jgi:heat shock protein HtpX
MNVLKTAVLLGLMTALLVGLGALLGGRTGAVVAFGVALVMNAGSYWFSDRIVLARYQAHEVTPLEAPRMHAIVDRLAASMRIPKPRVFVVPEQSPNAFATGRSPQHAAIAATEGLLELMTDDELEGVLGHELGHVLNRDILTSTVAATLAGAVMLLAQFARFIPLGGGGGGRERRGVNPLALLLAMLLAPLAATLLQLFVSRTREYAADETGARVTGHPESLARALEKLGQVSGRIPMEATPATSHLFIVRPHVSLGGLQALFSTHPPLEQRIARLRAMEHR